MILCSSGNCKKEIGIGYIPYRLKPCLVIREGNAITKYASFNNTESAREFMDAFTEFLGMPKIDWTGDDIPWGLMHDDEIKAGEQDG